MIVTCQTLHNAKWCEELSVTSDCTILMIYCEGDAVLFCIDDADIRHYSLLYLILHISNIETDSLCTAHGSYSIWTKDYCFTSKVEIEQRLIIGAGRATYVVDGRFFGHFFWKVEGTVRIHVNSRVAHVWLPYTVINVQGVGGKQTSENSENLEIF